MVKVDKGPGYVFHGFLPPLIASWGFPDCPSFLHNAVKIKEIERPE
jgi:hypothetical protein